MGRFLFKVKILCIFMGSKNWIKLNFKENKVYWAISMTQFIISFLEESNFFLKSFFINQNLILEVSSILIFYIGYSSIFCSPFPLSKATIATCRSSNSVISLYVARGFVWGILQAERYICCLYMCFFLKKCRIILAVLKLIPSFLAAFIEYIFYCIDVAFIDKDQVD